MFTFFFFFFSSSRRHTTSISAFLLNRSSDLRCRRSWSNRSENQLIRKKVCFRLLFLAIIQTFFLISWFSLLLLQLLRHLFYRHLKLHRQRYILKIGRASCRER